MKIRGFFALCIFRIRSRIEVVHESAAIRGKKLWRLLFLTESGKSPAGVSLIATSGSRTGSLFLKQVSCGGELDCDSCFV